MSRERAVGIDLGTTFSAIATVDENGRPRALPNLEGDLSLPSVVHFSDAGVVVGKEAAKVARFEPDRVAQFAKRDMGRDRYHRPLQGRWVPPEVVQALILRKLHDDAAAVLGEFSKVVITVPAYFNEPRRRATMDAGRLAGLEVLDIINEPTAAALAHRLVVGGEDAGGTQARETVLVYDLGGGTFDVTLMEIAGRNYRAIATDGDVYLGGIDWDRRLANHVAALFEHRWGTDPMEDGEALQALLQDAEDAKRALSARDRVTLHFVHHNQRLSVPVTRPELEAMTADLVERTLFTTKSLLREAGGTWSDLTRILLVGGSSRMPMIQRALEQESGMAVDRSLLAEQPVALGAALYAAYCLDQRRKIKTDLQVRNVSSHPLGVLGAERETGMPRRKILIRRNTPLPASGTGTFCTLRDNQPNVLVPVVEGGDDSGRNATPIGQCKVSGLPPGLPAGTRVKVRFAYGANGRLQVQATLPGASSETTIIIERASGLSDDEFQQWRSRIERGNVLEGNVTAHDQPERGGAPARLELFEGDSNLDDFLRDRR